MSAKFYLSCNACGYPILGRDLRRGGFILVTGPLVESAVDPCARNISETNNAGRVLTAAFSK